MSRQDELKEAIAEMCAQLKGPMPNLERALLVADREDLRHELAQLDEGEKPNPRSTKV
jgi:hypothetical protein